MILTALLFFVQSAFADVEATLEELRTAKNARVCQQSYAMLGVGEKRVKVEELEPNMKFNRKTGVQAFHGPSDIPGYDPTALYIGIANQEMHGNHHFYVNIGKVHAARKKAFGRKFTSNGHMFFNGVMAEIPLPPEVAKGLEARAKAGKFGGQLSCLHAVCDLLEKENIIIHARNGQRSVRTKVVTANLIEGKIKIAGKDVDSETMRILSTGKDELAHFLYRATTADAKAQQQMKVMVGATSAVFVVVGGGAAAYKFLPPKNTAPKSQYRPLGTNLND